MPPEPEAGPASASTELPSLFGGRHPRYCESIGFIQAPIPRALDGLERWLGAHRAWRDERPLEAIIASDPYRVFVATDSDWTAMFGPILQGPATVIAGEIGVRAINVELHADERGRAHFVLLEVSRPVVRDPPKAPQWADERALICNDNDGRWEFNAIGDPYPFEDLERYEARRVRDRFTPEMLVEYCAKLGLRPFDESFYSGDRVSIRDEYLIGWVQRKLGRYVRIK